MSTTIHLYNGNILRDPVNGTFTTDLTISNGIVVDTKAHGQEEAIQIDLSGSTAIPGLIDSHMHLIYCSTGLGIDLSGCTSETEFREKLTQGIEADTPWLLASGWTEEKVGSSPTMNWLPKCTKPVLCYRNDFHTAICNDALLSLLDVRELEKLPGGANLSEGIVKEDVLFHHVIPLIPKLTLKDKKSAVDRSISYLHAHGVTSVGTMEHLNEAIEVLAHVQADKQLRCFVMCLDEPDTRFISLLDSTKQDSFFKVIGVKTFLDGTLGSRSAKMYKPWLDDDSRGVWASHASNGQLSNWIAQVLKCDLAPVMHAIGDEAVGLALLELSSIPESVVARIEHGQCIAEKDMYRLKNRWFGVQPLHQVDDCCIAPVALGTQRSREMHNWRRMIDGGANLSFGSDWPIAPPHPLDAMQVSILNGLTPHEALVASTINAGVSLQDNAIGHLLQGAAGDVVVLDCNPLECNWKVTKPTVTMTIQAGKVVYEKEYI